MQFAHEKNSGCLQTQPLNQKELGHKRYARRYSTSAAIIRYGEYITLLLDRMYSDSVAVYACPEHIDLDLGFNVHNPLHAIKSTYDHRSVRTGHPVRNHEVPIVFIIPGTKML
jgi:hypothetical protein